MKPTNNSEQAHDSQHSEEKTRHSISPKMRAAFVAGICALLTTPVAYYFATKREQPTEPDQASSAKKDPDELNPQAKIATPERKSENWDEKILNATELRGDAAAVEGRRTAAESEYGKATAYLQEYLRVLHEKFEEDERKGGNPAAILGLEIARLERRVRNLQTKIEIVRRP